MAKKDETKFKDRIRPKIEALPKTLVIKIQQASIRGDPDFVIACNGRTIWMELKRDKKQKAEPLQAYRLIRAQTAGAISMVVSPENWDLAFAILQKIANLPTIPIVEIPACLLPSLTKLSAPPTSSPPCAP